MRTRLTLALLLATSCGFVGAQDGEQPSSWDYSTVLSPHRFSGIKFGDLPGFTRSSYARNYALVTPESLVFAANPLWTNTVTAHTISPVVGANFAMFLAQLRANSSGGPPAPGIERFIFVLDGVVEVTLPKQKPIALHADDYAYIPAGQGHTITSADGAGLVVFERQYVVKGSPSFSHGSTAAQPLVPVDGEVFRLRKLLPQTSDFDFNIHVMDFLPGEYLNVKEVHYNQHGLLLLAGQGIYRLGDAWFPVQAGDVIWMAPYVPQWYAALGTKETRYLIYKDTTVDPLAGHGVAAAPA